MGVKVRRIPLYFYRLGYSDTPERSIIRALRHGIHKYLSRGRYVTVTKYRPGDYSPE